MQFSKKASKNKNFNVTNYNDEQKDFFIGLGFTERVSKINGTIDRDNSSLSYHGSNIFGFWNDQEVEKIHNSIQKKYGKFKVRTLTIAEQM